MNGRSAAPIFKRFQTLLIANRGEIACRIIRTARRMGLRSIAVYSDADRDALHVTMADEAIRIGPPRAKDSYLNIDAVLEAARKSEAEAIHPGYGFLSESAEFAQRCADDGLVFVGPPAEMIEAMGSKSHAKALMEKAGVPLVPGYHGDAQDDATFTAAAQTIGFPVLVKASAGGGGRGMRIVRDAAGLTEALASARRESKAAFGDDRLLIEKYLDHPRHIEVQIVGDSHGNLVSLFERECTLQRRHQKVVEEAPSPTLDAQGRERIAEAARKAAGVIGYIGAGTIEFVSDGDEFFFIEMNTRLQVEHPVTEMITGIDLVEWQLRVAFGETLPLRQDEIRLHGHAVEARLYAEDPARNFMPSAGTITNWRMPAETPDLRIDAGYRAGSVVSANYDPMLAKVISFAPDRATALGRITAALGEIDITGVATNVDFLTQLTAHPSVRVNRIDTGFIEREINVLTPPQPAITQFELAAAVAAVVLKEKKSARDESPSPWLTAWVAVGVRRRIFEFRGLADAEYQVELIYRRDAMTLKGAATNSLAAFESTLSFEKLEDTELSLILDGQRSRVVTLIDGHEIHVRTSRGRFALAWQDPFQARQQSHVTDDSIVAPLPGTVAAVFASEGDWLDKGAPIMTLEVMKMEQVLRSPVPGVVRKLACKVGDVVQEGTELAQIEMRPS